MALVSVCTHQGLIPAVKADPEFKISSVTWRCRLLLCTKGEPNAFLLVIDEGQILSVISKRTDTSAYDVRIEATNEQWTEILAAVPKPFYQDVFAASHRHGVKIDNTLPPGVYSAYMPPLRQVFEIMRRLKNGGAEPTNKLAHKKRTHQFADAVGRYIYLDVEGREYRVYFEESGNKNGIGLICQHTAGAHGQQWRHVLENKETQKYYRIIVADLPYHGKSLPPDGEEWWKETYVLTRSFFMNFIVELSKALGLDRPVFIGSSIGGMLAVDLARYHSDNFRAVIGVEAAMATDTRVALDAWGEMTEEEKAGVHSSLMHPYMNGNAKGTYMLSLTAPQAPEAYRRETGWIYSQGSDRVFAGDVYYYSVDHDLREEAKNIDTNKVAVHLLTGEYDWSCTPKMSEQLAAQIKGSSYKRMGNAGHFPMAEDPTRFLSYVQPILEKIAVETAELVAASVRSKL